MKKYFLIPLGLFAVLAVFLAVGLNHDPHEVPSPLIGKPAPMFSLPRLDVAASAQADAAKFTPQEMRGKVWMLNVWATWCGPCRQEHPVLVNFAKLGLVPVVGLNYKDKRDEAQRWLTEFGNPYVATAVDADGRVGIDYGVYGVPETYLIDKTGTIRFKQIGPLTDDVLRSKVIPMLKELGA
ncbi:MULTISPECIES: DsbE family thiol:disulfide interchange protein [unclassified Rhizobacter]|uniref:DsbE family thiol:disulfide interchange protein n=1 Tax=unclassified Rhizobacter TaxID=2640088 RepID=UPI0006FAF35C|nr:MULTISPECIES: DsbE family thiol:disulfide interchange protein [unclassified Rhizobacter]KQU65924.1 thiol:disulfide interchange protein [Rhizobacter sp. Root29]KQV97935.1 thiol:disulfide interchange protein [Rhizobacter sp. Root1238]KRB18679.1 thiol:disulfide interchange protein [Rhizobacter sp. Root16D2]